MKKFTRYRDRKTGRFVKQATWRRSKAHGGSRFVRSRIVIKAARKPSARIEPTRLALPPKLYEWIVTIVPSPSSQQFRDFIVTAQSESDALIFARQFIEREIPAIARFYEVDGVSRGNLSNHREGFVEYRMKKKRKSK
jgi:hypothetical protein